MQAEQNRQSYEIVFFGPLSWEELQRNGYRKTAGAMFKCFWEHPSVERLWYVEQNRRWGTRVERRTIDSKLEIIGLPIGLPYERLAPLRQINRALQARLVAQAAHLNTSTSTSIIRLYWFYDWLAAPIVHRLPRSTNVMEITDSADQFFATSPSMLRQLPELRKQAAKDVDTVFVVNPGLAAEINTQSCHVEVMPNGVSAVFLERAAAQQPEPAALSHIQHPRLCVVGTPWSLNHRVDHELLANVLEHLPNWQLVLIGCDTIESEGLGSLTKHPRVHSIGMVPQEQLVGFIQHSDVCAVPYIKGPVHRDSLKVYEYVACGRPVVLSADEVAGDLRPFVKQAENAADFAELCLRFYDAKDTLYPERLRLVLGGLTWERRADACLALVGKSHNVR